MQENPLPIILQVGEQRFRSGKSFGDLIRWQGSHFADDLILILGGYPQQDVVDDGSGPGKTIGPFADREE
jgi:hypothetical protein